MSELNRVVAEPNSFRSALAADLVDGAQSVAVVMDDIWTLGFGLGAAATARVRRSPLVVHSDRQPDLPGECVCPWSTVVCGGESRTGLRLFESNADSRRWSWTADRTTDLAVLVDERCFWVGRRLHARLPSRWFYLRSVPPAGPQSDPSSPNGHSDSAGTRSLPGVSVGCPTERLDERVPWGLCIPLEASGRVSAPVRSVRCRYGFTHDTDRLHPPLSTLRESSELSWTVRSTT